MASPFPPAMPMHGLPPFADPQGSFLGQPDPQQAPPDPEQQIADALDQIRQALSADGFTEQEKLTLEKVTTLLQGLSATRASEQQAAMGGGPATNFIRRAVGG